MKRTTWPSCSATISTAYSKTDILYLKAEVVKLVVVNFDFHFYLFFHCAKLRVEGLEVVSETAVSVHSNFEVSQRHLAQPVRAHHQP